MDLFCPHCTRRVSVSDDKAGLITNCPLCSKQFMAPALAPVSAPKPPPPPPISPPRVETFGMEGAPAAPRPMVSSAPPPKPEPAAPPPPPLPPGEYTRSLSCTLNDRWLAFVPSACLIVVFFLSFFNWHSAERASETLTLWGLATGDKIQAHFVVYTILMFLSIPAALVAMVFDKGWFATPPVLAPLITFKNLLVGLLLGLAFSMLCIDYAQAHFSTSTNPVAVALKLAIRLQFLAMIASFALFWLNWRKRGNLPLPKIDFRW